MWNGMNRAERRTAGLTLMEILVAVIITGLVLLAIGQLESLRLGTQRTQESMDTLQRQAQQAMYHMEKQFYAAYFFRFNPATPSDIHIQTLRPGALEEPAGGPPNPALLEQAASYRYARYYWDAATNHMLYEEHVRPDGSAIPGATPTRTVLATHVQSVAFAPVTPNVYAVTVQAHDPNTDRTYVLGPIRLASREMVITPPPGWQPPLP